MPASVDNYYIGKGIVSFKPTGGAYRDLGNCPTFEFTAENEELEHYSSRAGVKTLDRVVSTSVKGTLKIAMEEFMLENLALAVLGSDPAVSGGDNMIEILANTEITGSFKLVGANDVGPKFTVEFFSCTIKPGAAIPFIGEEWGQMEIEASVQRDETLEMFGTITLNTASTEV